MVSRGEVVGRISPDPPNRDPKPPDPGSRSPNAASSSLAPIHSILGQVPEKTRQGSRQGPATTEARSVAIPDQAGHQALPFDLNNLLGTVSAETETTPGGRTPHIRARALLCMDCSNNKVVLAQNVDEPLPIASITKLLTAMLVIDRMDLNRVLEVPPDILRVPRHRVGLRPGDMVTVKDLLHGLLIESGNDCAEVLARAYRSKGKEGFVRAMNALATRLGAKNTAIRTPSGLDLKLTIGRKEGREFVARRSNMASARDVALIAEKAFQNPTLRQISTLKTYSFRTLNNKPRTYSLKTNDRLLSTRLPVSGAKTGYTDVAGRCIVARFQDAKTNYMVVVLNTPQHFRAAERIFRWASRM